MYLGIILVLAATSVKEAAPHNAPRPPGPYWRNDRVLDVDTGAGAVTYINIYGSQLGSQGSSFQTETERSSDSDMWMVVMMMYLIMSKESSSLCIILIFVMKLGDSGPVTLKAFKLCTG